MNRLSINIKLLVVFGILLIGTVVAESFFRKSHLLDYAGEMKESVRLTKTWFSLIDQLKRERGVKSDAPSNVPYSYMLGDEWSEITTTLGSLEAKETSTNPDFSALAVRLLHEANITRGDKVGVVLSGSFPSLSISVLAALQTMGIEAVVMSSVGASTYGANQPEVTWMDMETKLIKSGGMKYKSCLVTIGAGEDAGSGLSDEGLQLIRLAAARNDVQLFIPETLIKSMEKRAGLFQSAKISLLINIGGGQTMLGSCPHSTSIPNGLHAKLTTCRDDSRGLIARMNEQGIPFIQLLDIKNLAGQYGIAISPGTNYAGSTNLYSTTRSKKPVLALILVICLTPVYFLGKSLKI
jgi:poly-gamma-glutamate system protein